jgi:tRNA G18 (ribose-2'-O)-methylase SpoU
MPGTILDLHDIDDPRLAGYRDLRDRDLRGPDGRGGLFMGETPLVIERMLARPGTTVSVLVADRHAVAMRERMDRTGNAEVPLLAIPAALLERLTGVDLHRGVLALGRRPDAAAWTPERAIPRRDGPLTLLACEDLTNIDNIGQLYRIAAAFALDAIVLSPRCHDPLYRKSLRVSMGHALAVQTARCTAWPDDLRAIRDAHRITLVAAAIGPGAISPGEFAWPERSMLVVGNEFGGLRDETLALCDARVRIPMAAGVDSLNVAVAAAICLERACRRGRA